MIVAQDNIKITKLRKADEWLLPRWHGTASPGINRIGDPWGEARGDVYMYRVEGVSWHR